MHAGDLEIGFRLGDWVFDPRLARISGNARSHALAFRHVRVLQLLAELREIPDDASMDPRCIVRVPRRGYALIAHAEPLSRPSRALLEVGPMLKSLLPHKKA